MAATQPHFQNLRHANVNELVILFKSLNCVAFPNSAVNRTWATTKKKGGNKARSGSFWAYVLGRIRRRQRGAEASGHMFWDVYGGSLL